ncbi:MAG: M23 family metallopeptidase [Chitinophagaceae bacterium]
MSSLLRLKQVLVVAVAACFVACAGTNRFPTETYYEFTYGFHHSYQDNTITFRLSNPLMCPLQVQLSGINGRPDLEKKFGTIVLREKLDTTIRIYFRDLNTDRLRYVVRQGDPKKTVRKNRISYPFPSGKTYTVIQGYNSMFSHNDASSRYAIDFNLQIGDTVTAADDGYVVGLIQNYKRHGTSKEWRDTDKGNYITLYHPHSGIFTQYGHIHHKGALVKMGAFVSKKQPIAISGMTGFTTTPHVHFNVKIPTERIGLVSTDIEFDNAEGRLLKKNDIVKSQ